MNLPRGCLDGSHDALDFSCRLALTVPLVSVGNSLGYVLPEYGLKESPFAVVHRMQLPSHSRSKSEGGAAAIQLLDPHGSRLDAHPVILPDQGHLTVPPERSVS